MEEKKFEFTRDVELFEGQYLTLAPIDGNTTELSHAECDEIKEQLDELFDYIDSSEGDITLSTGRKLHYTFDACDLLSDAFLSDWKMERGNNVDED